MTNTNYTSLPSCLSQFTAGNCAISFADWKWHYDRRKKNTNNNVGTNFILAFLQMNAKCENERKFNISSCCCTDCDRFLTCVFRAMTINSTQCNQCDQCASSIHIGSVPIIVTYSPSVADGNAYQIVCEPLCTPFLFFFIENVKSERVSQLNNQFRLKLILIFIPKCCQPFSYHCRHRHHGTTRGPWL